MAPTGAATYGAARQEFLSLYPTRNQAICKQPDFPKWKTWAFQLIDPLIEAAISAETDQYWGCKLTPHTRFVVLDLDNKPALRVAMEVAALLKVVHGEMSRQALQTSMGLKNADHFRRAYILPAIAAGCLEMTLPEQPNSRLQRYRLTPMGKQWLRARIDKEN